MRSLRGDAPVKVTIRPLSNGGHIIDLPPNVSVAQMAYLRSVLPKRVRAYPPKPTTIDIPDISGGYQPSAFTRRSR